MKTKIIVPGLDERIIDSNPINAQEIPAHHVSYVLEQINPLVGFVVEKKGKDMKAIEVANKFFNAYATAKAKKKSISDAIVLVNKEILDACKSTFHNCILMKHNLAPLAIKIIGEDKEIPYEDVLSITYDKVKYVFVH